MSGIIQWVRDELTYSQGYLSGRYVALPNSFAGLYGATVSKLTSLISIPLPLLSMLALPIFGGSSTTISLGVFWLTCKSRIEVPVTILHPEAPADICRVLGFGLVSR